MKLQLILSCIFLLAPPVPGSAATNERTASNQTKSTSSPTPYAHLSPKERAQLEAIGYLSGYVPPPKKVGVTIYDRERAYDGLNFFSSLDRPSAYLMDMQGNVLHEWGCNIHDVWPDRNFDGVPLKTLWRRVYLYPNGDILAIFENIGILKLDKDSNILWKNHIRVHHDLEVLKNGDIWILSDKLKSIPEISPDMPVQEDYLTLLDATGIVKREISLLSALENSPYRSYIKDRLDRYEKSDKASDAAFDVFHTNTVEVLDGRAQHIRPQFRKGNFLVSFRALHTIAVIDQDTGSAVWAYHGIFRGQHDPKILDNGHLLLFDNVGPGDESAVLEYDLKNMDLVWSYTGTEEFPFFSKSSGTSARLPNGDTLITETNSGRAFEVTKDKEIVWEYFNPNKTGENRDLIAGIPEMIRLDRSSVLAWLGRGSGRP